MIQENMPENRKAWGDGKMRIQGQSQGSEVREARGQGSGFRVRGSNCKLQIANCKFQGSVTIHHSSSIIHHLPSPSHPSSFILPYPSRRGFSLIEVLVSIFVLSHRLLGVALLIPLGQIAFGRRSKPTARACGRAAMREIEVRRMPDYRFWYWRLSVPMGMYILRIIVCPLLFATAIRG